MLFEDFMLQYLSSHDLSTNAMALEPHIVCSVLCEHLCFLVSEVKNHAWFERGLFRAWGFFEVKRNILSNLLELHAVGQGLHVFGLTFLFEHADTWMCFEDNALLTNLHVQYTKLSNRLVSDNYPNGWSTRDFDCMRHSLSTFKKAFRIDLVLVVTMVWTKSSIISWTILLMTWSFSQQFTSWVHHLIVNKLPWWSKHKLVLPSVCRLGQVKIELWCDCLRWYIEGEVDHTVDISQSLRRKQVEQV